MVPAAPWPWPGEPVMWLQPVDAAVVDVTADVVDVVVDGEEVVEVARWLVVVVVVWLLGLLLQAANTTPAHATMASAQRGGVTLRSPPAARNRGTGGTGPPARPGCPPPRRPRRAPG